MFGGGKQGWIGVDLGTGAVKIAQVVRLRNRLELADAAIVRRAVAGGEDHDVHSSADEILGGLSLAQSIRGRRAAGVLSMNDCEFHALRVEEQPPAAATVHRELVASAALRWKERTFDTWATNHASDNPHVPPANVGVISTTAAAADRAAADLASANLDCQTLDATPTALARAMRMMTGARDIPLAAIDWGYQRATYCAIREGRPLYVRNLKHCGYGQITEQLAATVSCSIGEAIDLLQRYGLSGAGAQQRQLSEVIHRTIREHLDRLHKELRRTLTYLDSHRRNLSPTGVVLFGAGATIHGAPAWLSQTLSVDVRPWQPDGSVLVIPTETQVPVVLLAQAIAASTLAWEHA